MCTDGRSPSHPSHVNRYFVHDLKFTKILPPLPFEYRDNPDALLGSGHITFQAGLGTWQSIQGAYCGG